MSVAQVISLINQMEADGVVDYARLLQFVEASAIDAERFQRILQRHGLRVSRYRTTRASWISTDCAGCNPEPGPPQRQRFRRQRPRAWHLRERSLESDCTGYPSPFSSLRA